MPQATKTKKLNIKPALDKALAVLSERNGEILARRHGVGAEGERQTLEKIGNDYDITRERVRQIEEASYLKIRNSEQYELLEEAYGEVRAFLNENCGAASEDTLMEQLVTESQRPYMALLLALSNEFVKIKESDDFKASWASDKESAAAVKALLKNTVKKINKTGEPVDEEKLFSILDDVNETGLLITENNVYSLLDISKKIQKGPFEKWGLAEWAEINPRGVRDKVFLVLERHGDPLHFRDLAKKIDAAPFEEKNDKNTHPQTVHNELIKDDRFVLIGRGTYALADWGYMPGTVKDVIMNILEKEGEPVEKDELIDKVLDQRLVQKNTILLNLQNREHFQRTDENKYYLA
ncbi:MAG: HTH domain-containing protein [Candidatus Spechtbacterales bacterium]|nr:HTH domain-containing protein [Candidatus Spechtbacterales bacterium]